MLARAREILPRLQQEYDRDYYSGIICERRARALVRQGTPGSLPMASDWFREAMAYYERAEAIRPAGNDDALLRWNACARFVRRHPQPEPTPDEQMEPYLE